MKLLHQSSRGRPDSLQALHPELPLKTHRAIQVCCGNESRLLPPLQQNKAVIFSHCIYCFKHVHMTVTWQFLTCGEDLWTQFFLSANRLREERKVDKEDVEGWRTLRMRTESLNLFYATGWPEIIGQGRLTGWDRSKFGSSGADRVRKCHETELALDGPGRPTPRPRRTWRSPPHKTIERGIESMKPIERPLLAILYSCTAQQAFSATLQNPAVNTTSWPPCWALWERSLPGFFYRCHPLLYKSAWIDSNIEHLLSLTE